MSFTFKQLNLDETLVEESLVHKTQTLTSGSEGILSIQYRSGSLSGSSPTIPSKQGSHWDFLSTVFYKSSSKQFFPYEINSFYNDTIAGIGVNKNKSQYVNKFNNSGSVLSIPQKYFGERIKPKSFTLTDNSSAKTITIKDDGNGNLYSSNAHDSRSSATSISSSDNYAGNIFYDLGIATITETGSWSGSTAADAIKYTDALVGSYNFKFDSTQTIYTKEFVATIKPEDFNFTMNHTVRGFVTGGPQQITATPYMLADFTSSGWMPYITGIQLYQQTSQKDAVMEEPIIIGKFPRPIRKRDDATVIFKIRLDI
jgi:hypothetical protein|tara:strand:+ start:453 stop:1391 length:939 start_codon:yes stop_codon:yes gene_type:complete